MILVRDGLVIVDPFDHISLKTLRLRPLELKTCMVLSHGSRLCPIFVLRKELEVTDCVGSEFVAHVSLYNDCPFCVTPWLESVIYTVKSCAGRKGEAFVSSAAKDVITSAQYKLVGKIE